MALWSITLRDASAKGILKILKNSGNREVLIIMGRTSKISRWCLARSAVELTTGSVSTKYYSLGKNIFRDNEANMFWMWNGWGFRWNYTNYAGDFYMLEG